LDGLDGELIIGDPTAPDCFNRTTSAIMSFSGNISELTYYVFDWLGTPYAHKSFEQRLHDLFEIYEALPSEFRDRIVILDQQRALSPEEATDIEYVMVAQGYEGVILRSPHSPYKHGRSTLREQGMMKLKRFIDVDLEVVGFEELYSNQNEATISETGHQVRSSHQAGMVPTNTLGSLICKWSDTKTVKVGSGFTADQRVSLWEYRDQLIGEVVKIKYQEYGMKDVPRLPIFIGFRAEFDR